MISITPQGQVYLCKTPLENDYKNQLTFSNKTSQLNYFNTTIQKSFNEYTYIKKDNVIRVSENIDKIRTCNYLFYRNNGFVDENGNVRVFYCFITNMEYINENATAITFETDVFQTWQFDIEYKRCFVEREHVNDDTVGLHTIPENLETGEYQIASEVDNTDLQDVCPVVATTVTPNNENVYGSYCGNRYEALGYYIFKGWLMTVYDGGDQASCISSFLDYMANNSKTDAIKSIFMAPKKLVGWTPSGTWSQSSIGTYYAYRDALEVFDHTDPPIYTDYDKPVTFTSLQTTRPTQFGNYIPKNNKLYVFPYSYINLTNNNGGNGLYKYEDFNNNTPTFEINGIITPSCSIRAIPLNYKKLLKAFNDGLQGAKYPICSWSNDIYTNWLTQQAVNIGIDTTKNIGAIIGGVAMGNVGAVASGIGGIAGTLASVYQHSLIPPQAEGNINGGDVGSANKKLTFTIQNIQVREEMAKVIDNYFSMFGYKVNDVKVPNITGRTNWNYVKTIDCNFDGNIPQSDLNIIKTMFNNGITLWHNANTMYDYSLNNTIV